MRKKVSSGSGPTNKFMDATGPEKLFCARCDIDVAIASAKKIGPGSWECPFCQSVLSNSATLPKLKPGERDEIYDQSSTPAADIPQMTPTGVLISTETIRVTWGPEKISPRKYNFVDVGPFEYTTAVQAGESNVAAFKRAAAFIKQVGEAARKERVEAFARYLEETFGPARD